ncbi:enoyl-CoA hydratase-related protein [Psychrosphaera aestuarii]|uniref:enoyl-CoA hydratase-related protein n=1 Tax=Psychrosphaera aestuarii TaxID=1266052 RepID=UPI001B339F39|nr:enoyl-CoA hydratase-related protein [Psychrosphaera aestuarii]
MSFISTSSSDGVLTITIDRLAQKNALSLEMYKDLTAALLELEKNNELKVAVIQGDTTCFTAGNDLNDFLTGGALTEAHPTVVFLRTLVTLTKPLIASVAGPAIGIGTTLLMHCDLVYAADNAVFQLPFSKLGLCPEAGSSAILPMLSGRVKAFELLVLGNKFDANEAQQVGLINKVVKVEDLFSTVDEVAHQIANLPAMSVRASKGLIVDSQKENINQVITHELKYFEQLLGSEECKSIISSFFKK